MSGTTAATEAAVTAPEGNYTNQPVKFFFRSKKNELGEESKRPTVELDIPHVTWTGLTNFLNTDAKARELVLSLVNNEIDTAARSQVNDETKPVNKQEELDVSKLDFIFLANQPKSERAGYGILKETWEAFMADYIAIMPQLTGRSVEQVSTAAKAFVQRLQPVKTNKPVLRKLEEYLSIWFTNTSGTEEFAEIYQFLSSKLEAFLNLTDEDLLANI